MSEDRVDQILRKITASGMASLSAEELAVLNDASKARRAPPTAVDDVDDDPLVTREEAAKAHCTALARGISGPEIFALWGTVGYVFTGRQPFRSEVERFKELVARVTCSMCDKEASRFFPSRYGSGSVCADCRDSVDCREEDSP